jgi:hypothetical protein
MTLRVLGDIRRFLEIFHVVQEIVSAQKTPTLLMVLLLYENLIVMLRNLATDLDEISHRGIYPINDASTFFADFP